MRKQRSDKGQYLLTPRDLSILKWIGHQYAVRLDQLQVLMTRESPEQKKMHGNLIGYSTMMDRVYKLRDAGYLSYARVLAHGPGWCWLTRAGMDATGLDFAARAPSWINLNHIYAINQVRLYANWRYWHAERSIRSSGKEGPIPDAVIWESDEDREQRRSIAIEVELSLKHVVQRERKLRDLTNIFTGGYPRVRMYVPNEAVLRGMERAAAKLVDRDRERIELVLAAAIDPGTPEYD
jgi:hypothetical protein